MYVCSIRISNPHYWPCKIEVMRLIAGLLGTLCVCPGGHNSLCLSIDVGELSGLIHSREIMHLVSSVRMSVVGRMSIILQMQSIGFSISAYSDIPSEHSMYIIIPISVPVGGFYHWVIGHWHHPQLSSFQITHAWGRPVQIFRHTLSPRTSLKYNQQVRGAEWQVPPTPVGKNDH